MWTNITQHFNSIGDSCLLCRAPASGSGLCEKCLDHLPHLSQACRQCGLPLEIPNVAICGECLASPPAFDRAVIPFIYAAPINRLIADLKYHRQLAVGRVLARQLAEKVERDGVDLLLPVPLHPLRLRERGFNQASEICRILSGDTQIPWSSSRMVRARSGSSQRESSRRERLRNVRGAFAWTGQRPCPSRVALVDDVVTTGATVRAAATCLKKAGADWVEVWAIARTPKA